MGYRPAFLDERRKISRSEHEQRSAMVKTACQSTSQRRQPALEIMTVGEEVNQIAVPRVFRELSPEGQVAMHGPGPRQRFFSLFPDIQDFAIPTVRFLAVIPPLLQ